MIHYKRNATVEALTFLSLSSAAKRIEDDHKCPFCYRGRFRREKKLNVFSTHHLTKSECTHTHTHRCTTWLRPCSLQCLTLRLCCPSYDLELACRQVDRQIWRKAEEGWSIPRGGLQHLAGKRTPVREKKQNKKHITRTNCGRSVAVYVDLHL